MGSLYRGVEYGASGEFAGESRYISRRMAMRKLKPVTPGELLREGFLVPMGNLLCRSGHLRFSWAE